LAAVIMLTILPVRPAFGYSVLGHQAIVDRAWEDSIKPLLLQRFPATTGDDLVEARAYAYGGCSIQDLGYYPFSSRYFSDLTHYVRSGAFVEALIRDSADVDEYAFALGALSHYAADSAGHQIAINKSVPLIYPKLRRQYGNDITYEDDPTAHMRTEFAFDVIQAASGSYAPNSYHRSIGFKISKGLVERAFFETYAIRLKTVLSSVDLALDTYRTSASSVIPEMARVAWQMKKDKLEEFPVAFSGYGFARGADPGYPVHYRQPGPLAQTAALWFRFVPRVGLFAPLGFKRPTAESDRLFVQSLDVALDRYRQLLAQVGNGTLRLEDINLDTGRPAKMGDYKLADEAFARLVRDIARRGCCGATNGLNDSIASFYGRKAGQAPATN